MAPAGERIAVALVAPPRRRSVLVAVPYPEDGDQTDGTACTNLCWMKQPVRYANEVDALGSSGEKKQETKLYEMIYRA